MCAATWLRMIAGRIPRTALVPLAGTVGVEARLLGEYGVLHQLAQPVGGRLVPAGDMRQDEEFHRDARTVRNAVLHLTTWSSSVVRVPSWRGVGASTE